MILNTENQNHLREGRLHSGKQGSGWDTVRYRGQEARGGGRLAMRAMNVHVDHKMIAIRYEQVA
jgi:hypothetical protein